MLFVVIGQNLDHAGEIAFWRRRGLMHPDRDQSVRDRQHDRTDKETNQAEGDQPADNAGEDQDHRQIGAMRISIGRSTLSSVPTTQLQISSTVPQVVSPLQ